MATATIPQIKVERREKLGSRYAARLRAQGGLPVVVYGHGKDPLHAWANSKEMVTLLHTHAHVIEAVVAGHAEPCLVKDVQWDHLGTTIVHVDLERVDLNESVTVEVDIKLTGEAIGLKEAGTILEHPHSTLEVECLVTQIPDNIIVDVSGLGVGDVLQVKDLKLPPGVKTTADPDMMVATVSTVKELVVEAPAAEGAAAAEPEAIGRKPAEGEEAAEGAAPAAGDKKAAAPAAEKKADKK